MNENTNALNTSKKLLPYVLAGIVILVFLIGFIFTISRKNNPNQGVDSSKLPPYPTAQPQIYSNNNSNQFGALAVNSNLPGVKATIDELEVNDPNFFPYSNTPPFVVAKIPVGSHTLRARKEGYLNSAITTEIKNNQLTSVEIVLVPNPELTNLKKAEAKMPITTNDYTIEFLNFTGVIQVNVFNPPFEANKQKAIQWFKEQGVSDPEAQGVEFNDLTKRYVPKSN